LLVSSAAEAPTSVCLQLFAADAMHRMHTAPLSTRHPTVKRCFYLSLLALLLVPVLFFAAPDATSR
jgi:hypothetical protein